MSCNLSVGVTPPHYCRVFDDSPPEQSSSFSDVAALPATTPDPVDVRLDTPIECRYATVFVADWVVDVEVQYLRRIRRLPEHFGFCATTISAADEDIKEGWLAVSSLLLRDLYVWEDVVETFFKR
ncbi:hypothetical protein SprV_0100085500 [Sparganum proliferum]